MRLPRFVRRTPVLVASIVVLLSGTTVAAAAVVHVGRHGVLDHHLVRRLTGHPSPALTLSASPRRLEIDAGDTTTVALRLGRRGVGGAVRFAASGLPAGSRAVFATDPVTGDRTTVRFVLGRDVSTGSRVVMITATGTDAGGRVRTARTTVVLAVVWHATRFGIAGDATGLAPGISVPLDLRLTNPHRSPIAVTGLGVTIRGVTRAAGVALPCGTGDYTVTAYRGRYPLIVPAHETRSLSALGVPSSAWPRLTMIDKPVNQDGCKGARLTLGYTGSAHGAT